MSEPAGLARLIAINASALTIGRLLNAAIGIVTIGITSRYLGVDLYGTLVTATVFAVIVGAFSDLGLWMIGARELAKRPAETRRLMGSLFTLAIGLSAITAIAGLAVALLVYSGPGDELEREAIALLVLAPLPFAAAAAPAGAYLIAMQRGYAAAVASTVASVALALLLVLAVVLDLGFTAVVAANAAQSIAFAAVLLAYTLPRIRFRPSWDPGLATRLLRWAIPLGGVYILTSLYLRIDVLLLGLVGSQQDVGIYGLAFKVVDTLIVLPAFVMLTLLPELARLAEQPDRRDELVQKAFTVMQVAVVPLLVLTVAFASEIVAVAGGSAFGDAAIVLQILMIGVAAGFLRAVFTEALIAVNRQVWLMLATGSLLGLNVALNLALIPTFGAEGAAGAFAACEAAALVLMVWLYRRIGAVPVAYRPARLLLAGVAMSAVAALQLLPLVDAGGPIVVLLVFGPLSLGAYVACLHALDAMPREVRTTLVAPIVAKLRRTRGSA